MYSRNSGTRTLKGNEEQFELAGNSGYRGKFQWRFDQGKWNIVRVSGAFELSELELTGLYCIYPKFSEDCVISTIYYTSHIRLHHLLAFCWRDTVAYERLLKKNAWQAALKWKTSVQPPDWWHDKFYSPKHTSINDTRPVAYFMIVAFILLIQHTSNIF